MKTVTAALCALFLAGCETLPASSPTTAYPAPPPPPSNSAGAQLDWRGIITAGDRDHYQRRQAAWTLALQQARSQAGSGDLSGLGALIQPDAALNDPAPPPGDYRCRTVKLGSQAGNDGLGYVVYGWFACRIEQTPRGLKFVKVTGSQRPSGLLFPEDDRHMVMLGSMALASEFAAERDRLLIDMQRVFPPMYVGMFFLTLGYGLFVNFDAKSSWAKLILFQIIAGLGIGPLFQSPIIALQAHINPRDIGTATATLGFVRQLATSSSVVIGEVVFQNQMQKSSGQLRQVLGPQLAQTLGAGNIGANVGVIDGLPANQKEVVRMDFANSLQPMWIMYTCFAAVGLLCTIFVRRKVLTREHVETKTGLEAEKANAAENKADDAARRESKRQSKRASHGGGSQISLPYSGAGTSSRPQTSGTDSTAVPAMPTAPSSERVHDLEEYRRSQHRGGTLSRLESGIQS